MHINICPKCKAGADERCRTLTTGRITDTHKARYDAAVVMSRMPRRIRPQAVPDAPIKIMRYFPTEPVITESDLDTLALLGHSRTQSFKILNER